MKFAFFACSFVETNFFRDLLTKSVFVRDPRPKVSSFYTILCQKSGFMCDFVPKVTLCSRFCVERQVFYAILFQKSRVFFHELWTIRAFFSQSIDMFAFHFCDPREIDEIRVFPVI